MMLIGHTDNILILRKRSYSRKNVKIPCTFSGVEVKPQTNGSNVSFAYYPLVKKYQGTMIDISAGGCGIQTLSPLGEKRYICVEFQIDGNAADIVIGTIVKLDKQDANTGYMMHIQFVKMTRKTRNKIFSFIFEYE
jgi:c-di-GMP-binding flagellar brake protein YcgR